MPLAITQMLTNSPATRLNLREGWVGDAMYAPCDDGWRGNGRNTAKSLGQITKIDFAAPGTLPPTATVYLVFKQADCSEVTIELHNCTTAAVPLAKLLADKINGVGTPGLTTINQTGLIGYTAALVPPVAPATVATSVNLTGIAGEKFSIEAGDFGITVNGVTNPGSPTITTTSASSCPGIIGWGLAVVRNIAMSSAAYQRKSGSTIASEYDMILSLPVNHPTEEFVGWTLRDKFSELPLNTDSCAPQNCNEGYNCNDCMHYMNMCCHTNKILLRLEALPTGTSLPGDLVGLPLYYRHTLAAGYTQLGSASVLGALDPNRGLARHPTNKTEWRIFAVANAARREVWAGIV